MLPDRVSNPGPLTYESGALPIALRGPALLHVIYYITLPNILDDTRSKSYIRKQNRNSACLFFKSIQC